MSTGDCVVTFTGTDATNKSNQWALLELDSSGGNSTNQNLQSGYGNRFYLKNNNFTDANRAGRIRYEPFQIPNQCGSEMCPSTTFAVAGGLCNEQFCAYEEELIIYFLPTNIPDLYYLLFPSINTCIVGGSGLVPGNRLQNNGIISCRPYSAPNYTNWAGTIGNFNCLNTDANFTPYCTNTSSGSNNCPASNGPLNANGMLINTLPAIPAMSPYNNFPNVYLFRVTKAP